MAKNGNGAIRKAAFGILIAGFIITVSAIVWDASHKSSEIEANRKDIQRFDDIVIPKVENNREACLEFRYKIDTLNEKMTVLNTEQKAMRVEQEVSFEEILSRLPE